MTIIDISQECLGTQYHGCGKAWAAIKDGEVVALRYMGDNAIPGHGDYGVPYWIRAVMEAANGLDERFLPTCHGSKALSALATAASASGDCPTPPRRERYRPTELLTMARAALVALDDAAFTKYRRACRDWLAQFGEVISGECSCTQFYTVRLP